MKEYKILKPFIIRTNELRFTFNKKDDPYMLIFLGENTTFTDVYNRLGIRRIDVRNVFIPKTKIPKTYLNPDKIKEYRSLKLFPFDFSQLNRNSNKSAFLDMSLYTSELDRVFKPTNYKTRFGNMIFNMMNNISVSLSEMKKFRKVLLYNIDVSTDVPELNNRKIFTLLRDIRSKKNEFVFFDDILLGLTSNSETMYMLLSRNRIFNFGKILSIMKKIKNVSDEDIKDSEIDEKTEIVLSWLVKNGMIDEEKSNKVKGILKKYLNNNKKAVDLITYDMNYDNVISVYGASILYNVSGDIKKSNRIISNLDKDKKESVVKSLDKSMIDEILEPTKVNQTSDLTSVKMADVSNVVDNIVPTQLFAKRNRDFKENLENDLEGSFKTLEDKPVPLKIKDMKFEEHKERPGELQKNDLTNVRVTLEGIGGKTHKVNIIIPRIDKEFGTFRINGRKKVLLNQLVKCPISFPKPFESRFESSYSIFRIHSKQTKKKYLTIYIGAYNIPLFVFLCFYMGLEEVAKKYKFSYKISDKKAGSKYFVKLEDKKFLIFDKVDTDIKEQLIHSLMRVKFSELKIENNIETKSYFRDVLIKLTGKRNSTYVINEIMSNIIDPVAKQVLINKQLPSDLENVINYMSVKVVEGFSQDNNDITNSRIRNSEVIVHLAQKMILRAYTIYMEQVLSGNLDAEFEINERQVLADFIGAEIVVDMEYVNPIEELSFMTKMSPMGSKIGGLVKKEAVGVQQRSVHPSYFGNVDLLDTPEGGSIGIIQQLSMGALISSSRGMFNKKEIKDDEYSGMLSTTSAMIPFLENNEGARIILATNQSKQFIPLDNPEPPCVQSGYESLLTNFVSDSFIKKSPCDGIIKKITKDDIYVDCSDGKTSKVDITPFPLRSGSGKSSLSTFIPIVKDGEKVSKNQIIAEGSSISHSMLALGRNLLVAVMPYKGYNFEDGIVISESLSSSGKMSSIHMIEEEILIDKEDDIKFVETRIGEYIQKGDHILRKTVGEISQLIDYEDDETVNVFEGQIIKKSPGGILADIYVYKNVPENKHKELNELADRTRSRMNMDKNDRFYSRRESISGTLVKFIFEQKLDLIVGDKLANRYGGKGIVSLIEKDSDMPRTPWGENIDIIINPLGITNRTNVGQLFELYCGLIGKKLSDFILNSKKDKSLEMIGNVILSLDGTKNKSFSRGYTTKLKRLSDKDFNKIQEECESYGFYPIIVPPFKAPTYKQIINALNIMKLKSGYQLYLPTYNRKTELMVPVGYKYYNKLEHLADKKLHARSTGPVAQKTLQPLAGKARGGGQRFGEGEVYTLMSYNAPKVLSELLGPMSDDMGTKQEIISEIVSNGSAKYREPKTSPTRELLAAYMMSLMLEID